MLSVTLSLPPLHNSLTPHPTCTPRLPCYSCLPVPHTPSHVLSETCYCILPLINYFRMLRQIFACSARNYKLSTATFPTVQLLQPPFIFKREFHYWTDSKKHRLNCFNNEINGKTYFVSHRTFSITPSRKDLKVKVAELGTVFVVFHLAMGLVWWGALYVLILQ